MNNLRRYITPLTRGIIWLLKDKVSANSAHYAEVDYLLDGLLTANLAKTPEVPSRVIIGKNFNHPFFVMITHDINPSELDSYLDLLRDIGMENDILVIDEVDGLSKIKTQLASLKSNLRVI